MCRAVEVGRDAVVEMVYPWCSLPELNKLRSRNTGCYSRFLRVWAANCKTNNWKNISETLVGTH